MPDTIELPTLSDLADLDLHLDLGIDLDLDIDAELERELELVLAWGRSTEVAVPATETTETTESIAPVVPATPPQTAFRVAQYSLARAALRREPVLEVGYDAATGEYHLAITRRTNKF